MQLNKSLDLNIMILQYLTTNERILSQFINKHFYHKICPRICKDVLVKLRGEHNYFAWFYDGKVYSADATEIIKNKQFEWKIRSVENLTKYPDSNEFISCFKNGHDQLLVLSEQNNNFMIDINTASAQPVPQFDGKFNQKSAYYNCALLRKLFIINGIQDDNQVKSFSLNFKTLKWAPLPDIKQ